MNISEKGKSLIKSFEGCRLSSYLCSANKWTIGYGHTTGVKSGQKISQEQADLYLDQDLKEVDNDISSLVKVPLSQNQYDALCSFFFNFGMTKVKSSTLIAKLNAGDYKGTANEFKRWNKINGVVSSGLVRRRQAEEELFNGY